MKLYLCGQRSFGRAALAMLLEAGHDVVGVSAPMQDEREREDKLWGLAGDHRINRLVAGALNASTLPDGIDLIVCAHSHDFVGRATRLRARFGAIGYHPSLLPLHRGRDAVRWTVKMGDRVTGGTVYWLSDTVDGGPIAAQDWCFVRPRETAAELWQRALLPMGVRLLAAVVHDISRGKIVAVPQDDSLATWEPSIGRAPLRRPDLPLLRADNSEPDDRAVFAEPPLLGSPEWCAANGLPA